jgi:hypothetical protein
MKNLLISAGDYSADLHGESLVRELRALVPGLRVTALGGGKLKSVSDRFLHDMVGLDVSGFTQPIKQFFRLMGILKKSVFPLLDGKEIDHFPAGEGAQSRVEPIYETIEGWKEPTASARSWAASCAHWRTASLCSK